MKREIDILLSSAIGFLLGIMNPLLTVPIILFFEGVYWLFVKIAVFQYRKRFRVIERPDLARKYGVKRFFVAKENVVHGYAGMVLVPENFDNDIVRVGIEMSKKYPGLDAKSRVIDYVVILTSGIIVFALEKAGIITVVFY